METTQQKAIAIAELNPIITDIAAFEGTIESIDVADEETQGQIGDLVKMLSHRRAKLEAKRESLVKPLNSVVREINGLFKPPRDRIDTIIAAAKKKMNRFAEAQLVIEREKKRQEQEEAERERREAEELARILREKAGQTAEATVVELETQAEKKVEKSKKKAKVAVSHGQSASVSVATTWRAQVVDVMLLCKAVAEGRMPTSAIEPNMRALEDIARETKLEREVDGVRYFEQVSTSVR